MDPLDGQGLPEGPRATARPRGRTLRGTLRSGGSGRARTISDGGGRPAGCALRRARTTPLAVPARSHGPFRAPPPRRDLMTTARREPAIEVASDWGDRWERLHQRAFIAVASVAALAGSLSTPLESLHAARTSRVRRRPVGTAAWRDRPWLELDREGRGPLAVLRFVARYLLLAALVVGLWSLAPVAMLVAFLVLSAWHFGEAEVDAGAPGPLGLFLETLTRGATPILAPLLLAPAETLGLFGTLTGSALAEPATPAWITVLCLPWVAARLVSWIGRARTHLATRRPAGFADLMEEVAVWAIFASLPVLVAFGLYFCLGHSLRHGLRVARRFTAHLGGGGSRMLCPSRDARDDRDPRARGRRGLGAFGYASMPRRSSRSSSSASRRSRCRTCYSACRMRRAIHAAPRWTSTCGVSTEDAGARPLASEKRAPTGSASCRCSCGGSGRPGTPASRCGSAEHTARLQEGPFSPRRGLVVRNKLSGSAEKVACYS